MFRKMSEIDVKTGIKLILNRIEQSSNKRPPELQYVQPTLVAVSKTKPVDLILDAYEVGQRHFGENYVQELVDKANDPKILEKCTDIRWHFIGHLQSNKINKIVNLTNMYMVETVDSEKLATNLNQSWQKMLENKNKSSPSDDEKLRIMLQINTSGEDAKSGIEPNQVVSLARHVRENCPNLILDGLMTIGQFGYDLEKGPNPDFICLRQCREDLCKSLNLDLKQINLSMGMSDDFEHAIEMGSTNVRVGSSIFGHRAKKN